MGELAFLGHPTRSEDPSYLSNFYQAQTVCAHNNKSIPSKETIPLSIKREICTFFLLLLFIWKMKITQIVSIDSGKKEEIERV